VDPLPDAFSLELRKAPEDPEHQPSGGRGVSMLSPVFGVVRQGRQRCTRALSH
jgi:hypothetical protein